MNADFEDNRRLDGLLKGARDRLEQPPGALVERIEAGIGRLEAHRRAFRRSAVACAASLVLLISLWAALRSPADRQDPVTVTSRTAPQPAARVIIDPSQDLVVLPAGTGNPKVSIFFVYQQIRSSSKGENP